MCLLMVPFTHQIPCTLRMWFWFTRKTTASDLVWISTSSTVCDTYDFIPKIKETLDCCQGATLFRSLDLQSLYWQVAIEDMDMPNTVFSVDSQLGFFKCHILPFGLTNALATFQRHLGRAWKDVPTVAYLDIIYSSG